MQTFEIILSVISGLSLICALGALIFSKKGGKAKLLGGFCRIEFQNIRPYKEYLRRISAQPYRNASEP